MASTRHYSSTLIISLVVVSMNYLIHFGSASGCTTCLDESSKPHYAIPNNMVNPMKVSCPRDALKLGVCANVLHGAVGTGIGLLHADHCCSVLDGLLDLEAAVCLCTAIKANILGININIPISLSLLINTCGIDMPSDFQCVSA